MATSNTLIQANLDDSKRGRVMGLFTMAQSMFPLGSLLVGGLAVTSGASVAISACGMVALFAAAVFARAMKYFPIARTVLQ